MATSKQLQYTTGFTETEILAPLPSANVGDLYEASDTGNVFEVQSDGSLSLYLGSVLMITKNSTGASESVVVSTESGGIQTLSAVDSTHEGNVVGGVQGFHYYNLSSVLETVDILGATQPITMIAGLNTTITGNNATKNIAGNTWNSSFYSTLSFDPNAEDFAVSWEIESTTGTIREMGGLDNNPSQNNSYSSIDYAIYQVNNYFYSRVYENGVATVIPNYSTFYFNVGDRACIKCVNNIITYSVIRAGVETEIYTSTKLATQPLYFKGAMNRGVGSSGASSMGNVERHTAKKAGSNAIKISGQASEVITDDDMIEMKSVGMEVQTGSTYSKIDYIRNASSKFDNGGTPHDLTVLHGYNGGFAQSTETVTF